MAGRQFSEYEPDIKAMAESWMKDSISLAKQRAPGMMGLSLCRFMFELSPKEHVHAMFKAELVELVRRLRDGEAIHEERHGWAGRVINYKRIAQLVSDALPKTSGREKHIWIVCTLIAFATIAVRNGASTLALNRLRRANQERLNAEKRSVSAQALDFANHALGHHGYLTALINASKSRGLQLSYLDIAALKESIKAAALSFEKPAPVEPKIDRNAAASEAEFDALVSSAVGPLLSVRERARLIEQLRIALGMKAATAETIARRIYNLEGQIHPP